jgi:coenzyme Q-binding protein COQ10
MPSFTSTRRVPFTPQQMYALVADAERYPEFLPMCTGLHITKREVVDGLDVITATMSVGFKTVSERFTTRATLKPEEPEVLVSYLDGPFHHLENRWRFLTVAGAAGPQCDVSFWIDYAFKSPMLGLIMGAMFDKAFHKFSEAFEDRARKVYGAAGGLHAVASRA